MVNSKITRETHSKMKTSLNLELKRYKNKLGLSWAKLSLGWGLKLEFEVEV